MEEHINIQNEDWRLQAVTTLAEDWISPFTGFSHKTGTQITVISMIKFGEKLLAFKLPNVTALFLDYANKLWQETQDVLINENSLEFKNKHLTDKPIYPKDDDTFFKLLEKRMASIVFSYSALESFANDEIPEDYSFEKLRDDKKCTEKYDKEQIEQSLSLDVKLGEVLPKIKGIKSPKGNSLWNKYSSLKMLRDRIIHLKSKDRKSSGPDEKSIWIDILNKESPNFSLEAKEIIEYFIDKNNSPRWFLKFPYK